MIKEQLNVVKILKNLRDLKIMFKLAIGSYQYRLVPHMSKNLIKLGSKQSRIGFEKYDLPENLRRLLNN